MINTQDTLSQTWTKTGEQRRGRKGHIVVETTNTITAFKSGCETSEGKTKSSSVSVCVVNGTCSSCRSLNLHRKCACIEKLSNHNEWKSQRKSKTYPRGARSPLQCHDGFPKDVPSVTSVQTLQLWTCMKRDINHALFPTEQNLRRLVFEKKPPRGSKCRWGRRRSRRSPPSADGSTTSSPPIPRKPRCWRGSSCTLWTSHWCDLEQANTHRGDGIHKLYFFVLATARPASTHVHQEHLPPCVKSVANGTRFWYQELYSFHLQSEWYWWIAFEHAGL